MLKYDVKSKKSWKLLQCKSKSNVNHESNGNVEHGNSNLMNFYPCSASCKFLFNVNHISNVFLPNVDFKTTRTKNSYIWFSFYRSHTSLAHCLSLDLNKLMLQPLVYKMRRWLSRQRVAAVTPNILPVVRSIPVQRYSTWPSTRKRPLPVKQLFKIRISFCCPLQSF